MFHLGNGLMSSIWSACNRFSCAPLLHTYKIHASEFSFYYSAACCTGALGSQAQAHWTHTWWPRNPWSRTWILLLLFCCVLHRHTGFSGTGTLNSHLLTTQSMITHLISPSIILVRAAQAHWVLRHRHTRLTPDDHAIHDHAPEFSFSSSAACCAGTLDGVHLLFRGPCRGQIRLILGRRCTGAIWA